MMAAAEPRPPPSPRIPVRLRLWPDRLGIVGPGLPSWAAARPILAGQSPYAGPAPLDPQPCLLPARERRRTTFTIRLALATAEQALTGMAPPDEDGPAETRLPPGGSEVPVVFACSGGDTEIIHRICTALVDPARPVSPGDFHNSVHNAPAGYWSIATRDCSPTVSLSAFDASFAAGLIETATQILAGAERVLLVAYDVPAPEPLWRCRPLAGAFAVAMLLGRADAPGEGITLTLELCRGATQTALVPPDLEALRIGNPAARALPLLEAVARRRAGTVILPHLPGRQLAVRLARTEPLP